MKKAETHTSWDVLDGSPIDKRMIPWQAPNWVTTNIPLNKRYLGLTVPVLIQGQVVEYWWKTDLTDAGLIIKPGTTQLSTTERDALVSPYLGYEIYNLTTNTKEYFDGTIWKTIATV